MVGENPGIPLKTLSRLQVQEHFDLRSKFYQKEEYTINYKLKELENKQDAKEPHN